MLPLPSQLQLRKQDAKDNTQLVDGDEDAVFIRLVDYAFVDGGQLAYAAGGPPGKPHEWMVSKTLSPNPSTVAMQAQNGFGRYGKLIVTGLINPKDKELDRISRCKRIKYCLLSCVH